MTPTDLELIEQAIPLLQTRRDHFTTEFYAILFELEPSLRRLFPDDLEAQRTKLFDELDVLITRATGVVDAPTADRFGARATDLGARHEVYGVESPMYELVEVALLGALRESIDGFDDLQADAWTRLYRLVADSMQAG